MGAGRDGGRDLYHRGSLIWKPTEDQPAEVWEGYTVLQVKHRATPSANHQENAAWLWGQVRGELDDWANPYGDRNPVPDFLIIITNVMLTPFPQVGGHDLLNDNIKSYLERLADKTREVDPEAAEERRARLARLKRIKKVRIWDGNQIQALLKVHPGIRNAFPGFLTAGDVFAALAQFTDTIPLKDLEEGLREHAKTTLMGEGFIYFDEAGSGDGQGIPVHDVAIDLPITFAAGTRRTSVVKYVLDRAEHVLAPGVTTQEAPRHMIVTGAPGNGKTTISKFLVQMFRAAMLERAEDLSDGHRDVIKGTAAALKRFGRELPKNRRWPMRIDLALYAQEGGLSDDSTLLRWIAHKVSRRSDMGEVKPWALRTWMQRWPWLLVPDGLDEVTEPAVRKRLIERVTEFVNIAEADKCDVLVVLTTRPVGYTENIAPAHFERIDLDFLELAEAVRYGELATKVRLRTDLDRIERVLTRLQKAADDEALQHLLRTPLQVLILTIIIDGAGQLAPSRLARVVAKCTRPGRLIRPCRGGSLAGSPASSRPGHRQTSTLRSASPISICGEICGEVSTHVWWTTRCDGAAAAASSRVAARIDAGGQSVRIIFPLVRPVWPISWALATCSRGSTVSTSTRSCPVPTRLARDVSPAASGSTIMNRARLPCRAASSSRYVSAGEARATRMPPGRRVRSERGPYSPPIESMTTSRSWRRSAKSVVV